MNRLSRHVSILIALAVGTTSLHAQIRRTDPTFSVAAQVGASWNGPGRWEFDRIGQEGPIKPGFGVGIGLEYGPILNLSGALLMPSVEIAFGEQKAIHSGVRGDYVFGIQRLPILFWAKVISETRVSPFVRIGIGAAKTDFRELYPYRDFESIRFHRWHFCWGAGGGISYLINKDLSMELFIDDWVSDQDLVGLDTGGGVKGIDGRYGMNSFGFRIIVSP